MLAMDEEINGEEWEKLKGLMGRLVWTRMNGWGSSCKTDLENSSGIENARHVLLKRVYLKYVVPKVN